jgi:3-hydroxyisobutyrate dehydrogenase-like beta-hydroxyacid dehydrogenase
VRAAVLGLGEAGARFAADLVAAGADVTAFDPAPVVTPTGVTRRASPAETVAGADVVLALTAAADAEGALQDVLGAIARDALYADHSTSAPALKAKLAGIAEASGCAYVDVALMSPVPGLGLRTPALASGAGAERYVALMRPLGAPVELVSTRPGDASTRKLLRSVTMKGLAALVIEAVRAADAAGLADWLWCDLVAEITAADEALLARFVTGTGQHAARRVHEMEACTSLLESLGVEPIMTRATVEALRRAAADGVPAVPAAPAN